MTIFSDEFELLLRSRYPLIYIPTREEERVEVAIAQSAKKQGSRAVYIWDFVDGYQGNPNDAGFGKRNPLQALEFVEKLPASAPAIFILRDFQRFLEDVSISRKLRNLARLLKSVPKKYCHRISSNFNSGRPQRSDDSFGISPACRGGNQN